MKVFLTIVIILFQFLVFSQKEEEYTLYLIGDTGDPILNDIDPVLSSLRNNLDRESKKSAIVYLGDNIYHNGLPPKGSPGREEAEKKMNKQLDNLKNFKGKVYFIPGNHDWNDAKKGGLKHINAQEEYIESYLDKGDIMIPDEGCPGPEVKKLSKNVILLSMDSQWWLHPHGDDEGFDKCSNKNTYEIIQELKDRLDQYDDKFIILAFHHPLFTNGPHNGHYTLRQLLFPLTELNNKLYIPLPGLGFLYPFFRTAFGAKQDLPHPTYQRFKEEVLDALKEHDNVIIASGHEHSLQYFFKGGNHYIVSGSGSKRTGLRKDKEALFASNKRGYSRIRFYKDGSAILKFVTIDKKGEKVPFSKTIIKKPLRAPKSVEPYVLSSFSNKSKASGVYSTSKFHQFLFGKTYREDWNTQVEVRNLNLSTEHGGLVPIKKGGGFSSNSLRLRAPNNKQYVLRSVQKGVVKIVPPKFRGTLIQSIFQDQIAASQPYAALAVPPLAKAAGVHYTHPEIVYIKEQEALGDFNEAFANALYLYEERPAGKWEHEEFQDNTKKIVGYNDVLKALRKSDKARINQKQVLKSRIFDIFLGDWDRHDDQWRWARSKVKVDGKDLHFYEPVPRDRDQVFFGYKGLVPRITKILSPELRKFVFFDDKIKNVKYLGFNARHFDRHFTNQMERSDWRKAAQELTINITEKAIDESIASLPKSIQKLRGKTYKRKLLQRKKDLVRYADLLYSEIAKYVNIPGTDKKDQFEIIRNPDLSTDVTVYDLNKKGKKTRKTYYRKFYYSETKEIRIYGLGAKDVILLQGHQENSILIRVIGGKGKDTVKDQSSVSGSRKMTRIYDSSLSDKSSLGTEAKFIEIKDASEHDFNREEFAYDATINLPLISYNNDDGLILTHLHNSQKYKWRKIPYGVNHILKSSYAFRSREFNLKYTGEYVRVIGQADFLMNIDVSLPSDRDNFFGLSNDRAFAFAEDEDYDKFKYRQQHIHISPAVQWASLNRLHKFTIAPYYEYANLTENEGKFISTTTIFETEKATNHYIGLGINYTLKKMNSSIFPTTGLDFSFDTRYSYDVGESGNGFLYIGGHLTAYNFIPLPQPFVWATRIGGGINYGNFSFYQAQFLGRNKHLRGFRENRIGGKSSLVWSNDLRIKLFKVPSKIMPFTFGIIGAYDYGRVWNKNEISQEGWHQAFGGGFWISPYDAAHLSFYFMNALSDNVDFDESTFSFQFGFPF
ncbi:MAG: BamA/TamA family outer membrane protein [Saprospiraceae bacterium]